MNIGILCPSEIAFRRFLPALQLNENFKFVGIAHANEEEWFGSIKDTNNKEILIIEKEKAENFIKTYGGKVFESYTSLIESNKIDAIYLPLPPALHYKWAKKVLENGKHLLCEKPFTTSLAHTQELLELAKEKNLAVHENYMFKYHSQLDFIKQKIKENAIGDVRLIRIDFGFPFRGNNDFRYNKKLGGGALLDCGGYTLKLATELLGNSAKLVTSQLNYKEGFEVDIYGSATIVNSEGLTAQVSFGMDNSYKCNLEIWGSSGTLFTGRILSAPTGFEPTVTIKTTEEKVITLEQDDTFLKSINRFFDCINDRKIRKENYMEIRKQAEMVENFMKGE